DRMITQLSDLLRATLNAGVVEYVPLRQELDFAEKYLAIEQTRFSDRLSVEFDAAADTLACEVPYLILQPLIENAIRHGISKNVGAGKIRVGERPADGKLRLGIADNGPGIAEINGRLREGVGLENTRARLEQSYGTRFELKLSRAGDRGTLVELNLPITAKKESLAEAPQAYAAPQIPTLST